MNKLLFNFKLLFLIMGLLSSCYSIAQCIDTLPSNTQIITSNRTIGIGGTDTHYLICPGVQVIYSGTQSIMNRYYLEENAKLTLDSYHYPSVYLKQNAELNAQHSKNGQSLLVAIYAEKGAIFTDTLQPFTGKVNWCSPLKFIYDKLPNAKGCPVNSVQKTNLIQKIKISPNPIGSEAIIELNNRLIISFQLTDLHGKLVYESRPESKIVTFNREGIEEGVYFITLTDDENKRYVSKLFIQ